ncbi:MAG: Kelch repeat-containing protein [Acidimicrobiales bacterium]
MPTGSDLADGLPDATPAAVHNYQRRGVVGSVNGVLAQPTIAWLETPNIAIEVSSHGVPTPVLQHIADALDYHPGRVTDGEPIDASRLLSRAAAEKRAAGTGSRVSSKLVTGTDALSVFAGGVHGEPALASLAATLRPDLVWAVVRSAPYEWAATFLDARTGTHVAAASGRDGIPEVLDRLADRDPTRCTPAQPPNTWSGFTAAPVAGRVEDVAVWTGREMVVWGGSDGTGLVVHADGAAYNPATQDWRTIAAAPLAGRTGAVAVWTGHRMIIWGGGDGVSHIFDDGAAYDPITDRWQPLPAAPIQGLWYTQAVWTGTEMIVTGGYAYTDLGFAAAYSPTARRWRRLPKPPTGLIGASLVWTGHRALLTGGEHGGMPGRGGGGGRASEDAVYDPTTNRWRTPRPPQLQYFGGAAVWDGHELVAIGSPTSDPDDGLVTASYDPAADRWRALSPPPDGLARFPVLVWTGRTVVAMNTEDLVTASFDPESNSWTQLPAPRLVGRAGSTALWTGKLLVLWGGHTLGLGRRVALNSGATYRPALSP